MEKSVYNGEAKKLSFHNAVKIPKVVVVASYTIAAFLYSKL